VINVGGRYEGRLEGKQELWIEDGRYVYRWVPKSFKYKRDSDPWWGLTEITA
jgi:hypothetical protein